MKVEQIARFLGASHRGDGALEIVACNALELANAGEIAFAEGQTASQALAGSAAGCVLVTEDLPVPNGKTVIVVPHPRNAFARIARELHPARRPPAGVHPTATLAETARLGEGVSVGRQAVIEQGVTVGPGSEIGAGAFIGQDASVGANCRIDAGARVYHNVRIGDRTILHAGAVIGAEGFGFTFETDHYERFPQIGTVEIGNDVEIGANSCVDRGALGPTVIGDGTKLDNLVHIGHNCRLGKHVVMAAQVGLSGGVIVHDHVVIGGQVGIGEKAEIGARANIGGQCGILPHRKVPPGAKLWGTPSRPHREYLQSLARLNRLPKVTSELDELRRRVAELEAAERDSQ